MAAVSWYELGWLARHERILVSLPSTFPGDPADRLIYATAIENGLELATKDQAIRDHDGPRSIALW